MGFRNAACDELSRIEFGSKKNVILTTEKHGRAQIKEVGSGNAECGKTESVEVGKDRWWDGARVSGGDAQMIAQWEKAFEWGSGNAEGGKERINISILRNITVEPIELCIKYLAYQISYQGNLKFGDYDNIFQEAVGGNKY